jgi:hypothetical protein
LSAAEKYYYVVGVGIGVGKLAITQHPSDCDGSAIFRNSTTNLAIWPNSYQNPMQFDLFPTSSKFRLTWVGLQSVQRPQKLHIGWGSSPHSAINPHCGLICGLTASINPLLAHSLLLQHTRNRSSVLCGILVGPHMLLLLSVRTASQLATHLKIANRTHNARTQSKHERRIDIRVGAESHGNM